MDRTRAPIAKKRLDGPARRELIVRAARDLFLSEGVDRASMRNIAARAGITPALIYQHFTDKDALLLAITEGYFEKLIAYMDTASAAAVSPVERLRGYMRAYIRCGLDHPHEYQLAFMTGLPRLSRGPMKDKIASLRAGRASEFAEAQGLDKAVVSYALFESAIAAVIAAGLARSDDAEILAQAVWACGHGLVSLLITHAEFGWAPEGALIEQSIGVTLEGVLAGR